MRRIRRLLVLLALVGGASLLTTDEASARGPCSDVIASDGSDCSVCEGPAGCYFWACTGGPSGAGCPVD